MMSALIEIETPGKICIALRVKRKAHRETQSMTRRDIMKGVLFIDARRQAATYAPVFYAGALQQYLMLLTKLNMNANIMIQSTCGIFRIAQRNAVCV